MKLKNLLLPPSLAVGYVRQVQEFLQNPPACTLSKVQSNGDVASVDARAVAGFDEAQRRQKRDALRRHWGGKHDHTAVWRNALRLLDISRSRFVSHDVAPSGEIINTGSNFNEIARKTS
jgi:hypothetical protein